MSKQEINLVLTFILICIIISIGSVWLIESLAIEKSASKDYKLLSWEEIDEKLTKMSGDGNYRELLSMWIANPDDKETNLKMRAILIRKIAWQLALDEVQYQRGSFKGR